VAVWLAVTCVVWAFVTFLSSGNLDGYHDMLENYAWSQPLLMGTHKHPPFFAWVVGLWFEVFPQTDWAYRLLSYANVAVGLWGVWSLGRRLGLQQLSAWGAMLLLWSFPYTTLAAKFNANSQLLSLWPWAAALLLASWQEKGLRGWWFSIWLGLVAAACMLSKYYSGVFLAGFLLPIFLNAEGRRWLLSFKPYLALLVFGLALAPHLLWVAHHDWATLGYAMDQGGGSTEWGYVLRFAFAPVFYWLPAWLAVCGCYAALSTDRAQQGLWRTWWRLLGRSWLPQGRDDVLFWLACMPWLLTLGFGITGVVELSTPWSIPIGYAFALLWLRNLHALYPDVSSRVVARLRRAWPATIAGVVVLGAVWTVSNAQKAGEGYYRPTEQAAKALLQAWQQRHPGEHLDWVGGDWAHNAMLSFYAQPHLRTVPDMPDSYPATLAGIGAWQTRNGLLLCPLGPQAEQVHDNACTQQARTWLQAHGWSDSAHVLTIARSGWRFPKPMAFSYAVFDVPASQPAAQ
jgi:4-amino-4-deoxy-L-arabinose transferase-like glycosyltransferase